MKIKLTSIYVDDQEKALRFYTDVLGFVKNGRRLERAITAGLPSDHRKSLRAPSCSWRSTTTRRLRPFSRRCSSRASQRQCSTPTACEPTTSASRLGAPSSPRRPTDVTASTIAILNDTCGNLIQLTELARGWIQRSAVQDHGPAGR